MITLREAAAAFVEAGRALGRYERAKADVAYLDECAEHLDDPRSASSERVAAALRSAADFQRAQLQALDREAIEYRMGAERLLTDIEDPGGKLARRVLRTLAAARAAWRG
jgi:hypothetical protein